MEYKTKQSMDSNNNVNINHIAVMLSIWKKRKLFFKTMSIAFVLACVWIIPQPRFYSTQVSLAPETGNSLGGDAISSLASSFGFDLSTLQSNDAIYPTLYPEILESTGFVVSLFDVKVTTDDGQLTTTYYDYLLNHQKANPYLIPFAIAGEYLSSLFSDKKPVTGKAVDPFRLTKKQTDICNVIVKNVKCSVDKKTDVITLTITDQDPYICACLADTVRQRLQDYIINYRTKKARHDMAYYERLTNQARDEYNNSIANYSGYQDSHQKSTLQSVKSQGRSLERDQEIKYNTYTVLNNQLQASKAKVQERTPAFTIIQEATVPNKPDGPKRMIFILVWVIVAFIGTAGYVLRDIVK